MKKLDRFILKAFIGPFVAILVIVIFILMLQFLWVYIDELVGKGLGLGVVLEFMLLGGCTILPLALPLATLLSSMMVLGQMGDHNELMAIKSAGISLSRVMLPLMIASLVISIGAFYVGNNLVPIAWNEIYTLRDDIGRTKNEIKIPAGTYGDKFEETQVLGFISNFLVLGFPLRGIFNLPNSVNYTIIHRYVFFLCL